MPKSCSICIHNQFAAINNRIIAAVSFRDIAGQFDLSKSSVARHAESCLKLEMAAFRQAKKIDSGEKFYTRLEESFAAVEKMIAACEKWLADPDDPNIFNISPRDTEITVVYADPNELTLAGFPVTKTAKLNKIFERLCQCRISVKDLNEFIAKQDGDAIETEKLNEFIEAFALMPIRPMQVKSDAMDNRKLFLDALAQFTKHLQLAAKVYGVEQSPRENEQKIDRVVSAVLMWLEDHPEEHAILDTVVRDFARGGKVSEDELNEKVINKLKDIH